MAKSEGDLTGRDLRFRRGLDHGKLFDRSL